MTVVWLVCVKELVGTFPLLFGITLVWLGRFLWVFVGEPIPLGIV